MITLQRILISYIIGHWLKGIILFVADEEDLRYSALSIKILSCFLDYQEPR